ncbi:MAG: DUF2196 domain-containing protein [Desulfobacterales bacterium]
MKKDQKTNQLTKGIVKDILTKSPPPPWNQKSVGKRQGQLGD